VTSAPLRGSSSLGPLGPRNDPARLNGGPRGGLRSPSQILVLFMLSSSFITFRKIKIPSNFMPNSSLQIVKSQGDKRLKFGQEIKGPP
jgi:hypothetical protein